MRHDELERQLLEAARDYNDPPTPPREEMWAAIRESLPQARATGEGNGKPSPTSVKRLYRWTPWAVGLAAAATLAVGFGLGRITEPGAPAPVVVAEGSGARVAKKGPSLPVRMAAADHMGEAEAMLTLFRASERLEDREAAAQWARALLGTTRMMMDSRLAEDPELSELLADLELVLVQIASVGDSSEDELIEDGIEERQLLAKLRSAASPVGAAL